MNLRLTLKRYKRCKVTDKIKYPTWEHAQEARRRTFECSNMTVEEFEKDYQTYQCNSCKKFHNGHRSHKEQRNVRASETLISSS